MTLRTAVSSTSFIIAIVGVTPCFASGVLPNAATPVQREHAQAEFVRGKQSMANGSYDEALRAFRTSYEVVASPNTRLEMARCMRATGAIVAAYAELGRVVVEAEELRDLDNRYARTLDAATAERKELEHQLGFVELHILNPSDDTMVSVGDEAIVRAAWTVPIPVAPGDADVVVETPGRAPIRQTIHLLAASRIDVTIDVQTAEMQTPVRPQSLRSGGVAPIPAPHGNPRRPVPIGAYIAGGVGVAGLATFSIFGLFAQAIHDDLSRTCVNGACPPVKSNEIDRGKADEVVANVGLAIGAAGALGCAAFILLAPREGPARPGAALVISPGWIGVRGSM